MRHGSREQKLAAQGSTQHPNLRALGGGSDDSWNARVANQLVSALPPASSAAGGDIAAATLSGLATIHPRDPVEAMIAAQIILAHEAAIRMRRLAWHPDQGFIVQTKFLELADKAARTVAALTESLDRHRCRGTQTVVVKHMTVNADQAVVADRIVTRPMPKGGGSEPK